MPATANETAIHKLEIQIAEINNSLKFIKWIGVFMATCALGLLAFSFNAIQKITQIDDAVASLKKDTTELGQEVKESRTRSDDQFKAQSGDATRIKESLERIEKGLARMQPAPSKASP